MLNVTLNSSHGLWIGALISARANSLAVSYSARDFSSPCVEVEEAQRSGDIPAEDLLAVAGSFDLSGHLLASLDGAQRCRDRGR